MVIDGIGVGHNNQLTDPDFREKERQNSGPAGEEQQRSDKTVEEQQPIASENKMPNKSEKIRKLAHERKDNGLKDYSDEMIRVIDWISQEADLETYCQMKFRRKFFVFGQVVMTCTKNKIFCELGDGDVLRNLTQDLADKFNKIPSKMYNSTNTYFSQEQEYVLKRVTEICKKLKIDFHIAPSLLGTLRVYISWWKG